MTSVTVYQDGFEECYAHLRSLAQEARRGNDISFMAIAKIFVHALPVLDKPCIDKHKNTDTLSEQQQKLAWIHVDVASSFMFSCAYRE